MEKKILIEDDVGSDVSDVLVVGLGLKEGAKRGLVRARRVS